MFVEAPTVTPGEPEGRGKGVQRWQVVPSNSWIPFPSFRSAGDDRLAVFARRGLRRNAGMREGSGRRTIRLARRRTPP